MHALRRHLVAFVTLLCLLGVQQVAALHELSHLPANGNANPEKQLPHSKACDKCASYAEVSGGGLPAAPLLFHLQASAVEPFPATLQVSLSATIPAYAARAPPFFL
jgi:hypothetical protein